MPLTSKEMIALLKKNGFIEIKCGNGSCKKLQNPLTGKTVIVPYHCKDLGKGHPKTSWFKIARFKEVICH